MQSAIQSVSAPSADPRPLPSVASPAEAPRPGRAPRPAIRPDRLHGRHLFAYFAALFALLFATRAIAIDLTSRFDLSAFPKLTSGVQQVLNAASEVDTALNTAFSLLYAFLFSLPVALVHRITREKKRFDPALTQTIVLLSMVVTAVITLISGDLARAFGLAGVVGAVRFRNSLDDARDAVYVFLAIAIGIACGARLYTSAVWTSLIMTGTLYLTWRHKVTRALDELSRDSPDEEATDQSRFDKEGRRALDSNQARIDSIIEQQRRLAHFAVLSREPGAKKLNAALIVEIAPVSPGQFHVGDCLQATGGVWRLARISARDENAATVEFVGRPAKGQSPGAVMRALLESPCSAYIRGLEFRSLKGVGGHDPAASPHSNPQ
ncbi:MAG: DUF4956 domain-containing protein [Vicinamibacteria bacterium]|nr:DUF4956 domain-containing protein [Vicinamibacteria bacterium]